MSAALPEISSPPEAARLTESVFVLSTVCPVADAVMVGKIAVVTPMREGLWSTPICW